MLEVKVTIPDEMGQEFKKLSYFLAEEFYERLLINIQTNKFGFSDKASTVQKKRTDIPMIDTSELISNIVVTENKVTYREGMHSTGISFEELGDIMEYGRRDKSFNGFPVWRLTIEEFKKDMPKIINSYLNKK